MKQGDAPRMSKHIKHPRRMAVLAALLFVVIVVVLSWTFLRTVAPPPLPKSTPAIVVNITDSGFVPATLAVAKGTAVTWHNQTASPHSIGADPYPSHSSLPDFYSGKTVIAPDASYSYTFTKTGAWGYSDYTMPTTQGTVTVK